MKPVFRVFPAAAIIILGSLTLLSSCKPSPTLIHGSVSFLNPPSSERAFPNALHGGVSFTDDVCYVRLVDNDGAGTTLWESGPLNAAVVAQYTGVPTPADGAFVASFRISPSDATLSGAVPPLRLEAYLYDTAVSAPIDPATNPERYTAYDATGMGPAGWYTGVTISPNEIKSVDLFTPLPYP